MATSPNFVTRATRKQALEERGLIRSQMRLGAGLILFGALSIPLFQVSGVLEGQAAIAASAVATAVIGAGAAMLPTGAAAGASARILRLLPDQDAVADDQHAARNGHPDNGRVPTGTAASTDHDPPPPRGQCDAPHPASALGPTRTTLPSASWHASNERHTGEQGVRLSRCGPDHQGLARVERVA
jgi:hypothetical protein